MNFIIKIINQDGKLVREPIEEGQKWEDAMTSNSSLNSIFANVDDGDGIVSQLEIDTMKRVFYEHDNNSNGIYEDSELEELANIRKESWEQAKKKVNVALQIYNDIYARNMFGFPTTGENFEQHIKAITPENVVQVMISYSFKTKCKESIFSGIMGEVGLKYSERAKYCKHIIDMIAMKYAKNGIYIEDIIKEFNDELNYQKDTWTTANAERLEVIIRKLIDRLNNADQSKNIAPNGKIDKNFYQGAVGDCWLLAPIKAISMSPKGLKILNDSIKVHPNGDVTVTLKGVKKSYTFTRKEIYGSTQLSTGDLDVRAVEMAIDKYIAEERGIDDIFGDKQIDINSSHEEVAYRLLLGKGDWNHYYKKGSIIDEWLNGNRYEIRQEHIDRFNNKNHIVCVSATRNKKALKLKGPNGNEVILLTGHSYAVSRADSKYIYLINPHDTSKEIRVSIKTFKSFFNDIAEVDL